MEKLIKQTFIYIINNFYHKIYDGDSVLFPIDPNINLGN